jgi:hypothetical protein
MSIVVHYAVEQLVISLLTNVSKSFGRWISVTQPGRLAKKSLKPVAISYVGETPPGQ